MQNNNYLKSNMIAKQSIVHQCDNNTNIGKQFSSLKESQKSSNNLNSRNNQNNIPIKAIDVQNTFQRPKTPQLFTSFSNTNSNFVKKRQRCQSGMQSKKTVNQVKLEQFQTMLSISQHSRVHSGFLSKPFLKRDFSVMQNQFDNEGKSIKASDYNFNQKVSALQSTQCNEESKQFYSHQVTLNEKNQQSNHTRTISKLSLFDQQSKTSFSKKQLSGSQFTRHYKHDSQPLIVHNSLIKENTEELEEIPVDIKTEDDQVQRRSFSHKMIIPYLINFDSVASIDNNNEINQKQNKFQSSIALNQQESPQKSFQQTVKDPEANNGIQNNQSQDKTQKIRKVSLIDIRKAKFDSGIVREMLNSRNSINLSVSIAQRHCSSIKERVKRQELNLKSILDRLETSPNLQKKDIQISPIEEQQKFNKTMLNDNSECQFSNLIQQDISTATLFGRGVLNRTITSTSQNINIRQNTQNTFHKRVKSAYGNYLTAKRQSVIDLERNQTALHINQTNNNYSRPQSRLKLAIDISRSAISQQKTRPQTSSSHNTKLLNYRQNYHVSESRFKLNSQNDYVTVQGSEQEEIYNKTLEIEKSIEKKKQILLDFANFSSLLKHNIMIQKHTYDDIMNKSQQKNSEFIEDNCRMKIDRLKSIYIWNNKQKQQVASTQSPFKTIKKLQTENNFPTKIDYNFMTSFKVASSFNNATNVSGQILNKSKSPLQQKNLVDIPRLDLSQIKVKQDLQINKDLSIVQN